MVFGRKRSENELLDPAESILTVNSTTGASLESPPDEAVGDVDRESSREIVDEVPKSTTTAPQERRVNPSELLTQILSRIDFLNTQFESRLKYDESRELQVTKLYDELDNYKQNAQIEQMLTLARGIFLVLDKLEPDSPFQMTLEHLREELIECLAVVGIERIEDSVDDLEAPAQVIVGFLDDSSNVTSRIRQHGYRRGDLLVRPRHIEKKK